MPAKCNKWADVIKEYSLVKKYSASDIPKSNKRFITEAFSAFNYCFYLFFNINKFSKIIKYFILSDELFLIINTIKNISVNIKNE